MNHDPLTPRESMNLSMPGNAHYYNTNIIDLSETKPSLIQVKRPSLSARESYDKSMTPILSKKSSMAFVSSKPSFTPTIQTLWSSTRANRLQTQWEFLVRLILKMFILFHSFWKFTENLKLLVRKESPKVAIDKRQFQILLSNKLIPYVYTQIIKFIPTLNYVYNSTVNDHIEVTEPVPEAKSVILLPKVSQPEQSDQVSASLVQPVITKQVEQADPLAPAVLSADESCPNLDQYAQLDVDFSRVSNITSLYELSMLILVCLDHS